MTEVETRVLLRFQNTIRPVSNVVLLPRRTKLIELNSTLVEVARRLKPSRATAVPDPGSRVARQACRATRQ